ncbi:hypothetical protein [Marinobacter phage PS6]|nr:hypothetical protein [Marinobacter phage PS6]
MKLERQSTRNAGKYMKVLDRTFSVAPMMDRFHREREVSSDKGFQVSRKPVVH